MAGTRLTGLWWKKDEGGEYLEGQFGQAMVRVFMNPTKGNASSPDAALYVVSKPKEGQPPGRGQYQKGRQGPPAPRGGAPSAHPYAPKAQSPPLDWSEPGDPGPDFES